LGLREEEVRVLWLMKHATLPVGRKVTAPAQLLDVAPTALDLLGSPPDPGALGRSFAQTGPRYRSNKEGVRFLIEGPGGEALVLDGHYKYVRRGPPRRVDLAGGIRALTDFEPEELYDLWTDPGERRNLALRRRDLLKRARRAIDEWGPERTATRLQFEGWQDTPLQGVVTCPGGDLWNVALSSGVLTRGGSNQAVFTVSAPEASFSFETWPPAASFTFSLRSKGHAVPADDFLVSKLGLPLIETEKRNDWFDENSKFSWMDGFPVGVPPGGAPRVLMGREPVREKPQ
jgi:hypothetical protein